MALAVVFASLIITTVPLPGANGCQGEFSGSGVLKSPGYPNIYRGIINCTWSLLASPGGNVFLRLESLDRIKCCSVSCRGSGSRVVCDLSSYRNSKVITTPLNLTAGHDTTFSIVADGLDIGVAFQFMFTTVVVPGCGGILNGSGSFSSPLYPKAYDNFVYCKWKLHALPTDGYILMQLIHFRSEKNHDFLRVYGNGSLLAQFHGSINATDIFLDNEATIVFETDHLNTDLGFNVQFRTISSSDDPTNAQDVATKNYVDVLTSPKSTFKTATGNLSTSMLVRDVTLVTFPSGKTLTNALPLLSQDSVRLISGCDYMNVSVRNATPNDWRLTTSYYEIWISSINATSPTSYIAFDENPFYTFATTPGTVYNVTVCPIATWAGVNRRGVCARIVQNSGALQAVAILRNGCADFAITSTHSECTLPEIGDITCEINGGSQMHSTLTRRICSLQPDTRYNCSVNLRDYPKSLVVLLMTPKEPLSSSCACENYTSLVAVSIGCSAALLVVTITVIFVFVCYRRRQFANSHTLKIINDNTTVSRERAGIPAATELPSSINNTTTSRACADIPEGTGLPSSITEEQCENHYESLDVALKIPSKYTNLV